MKNNIIITFFSLIWRGAFSLPIQLWLVFILGGKLVSIISIYIMSTVGMKEVSLICLSVFIIYYFIAGVGVWRAADKYKGPKIWTYLSKLFVLIAIIVTTLFTLDGFLTHGG
jgi:hypothetical protein